MVRTYIGVDVIVVISKSQVPQNGRFVQITQHDHVVYAVLAQILSTFDLMNGNTCKVKHQLPPQNHLISYRAQVIQGKSLGHVVNDGLHSNNLKIQGHA